MVIFDREKNIIDGIFGNNIIIREKDVVLPDESENSLKKEFLNHHREKLIELIKENSYYFYLPDEDQDRNEETGYFMRNDKLKEEYAGLDEKVKEFFNGDIAEYAEYRILKQYKKNFDEW